MGRAGGVARGRVGVLASASAAVVVAALLSVVPPAAAAAAAGEIRGPGDRGTCIDVAGADATATGAPVQRWGCLGVVTAGGAEGDHYGFSGQLRALAAYRAPGRVSPRAYLDPARPDLAAADDGAGGFAALAQNGSGGFAALAGNGSGTVLSGQDRSVPGTSPATGAPLDVRTVSDRASAASRCTPIAGRDRVTVETRDGGTTVHLRAIDPWAAVPVGAAPAPASPADRALPRPEAGRPAAGPSRTRPARRPATRTGSVPVPVAVRTGGSTWDDGER